MDEGLGRRMMQGPEDSPGSDYLILASVLQVCILSHSVMFDCSTIYSQALLSMEFPRYEYWNGLPFLSPGDLPNPVIEPGSPALQADSLLSEPPKKCFLTWEII